MNCQNKNFSDRLKIARNSICLVVSCVDFFWQKKCRNYHKFWAWTKFSNSLILFVSMAASETVCSKCIGKFERHVVSIVGTVL